MAKESGSQTSPDELRRLSLIHQISKDETKDPHVKEIIKLCLSDKLNIQTIFDGIRTELISATANQRLSGSFSTDLMLPNLVNKAFKDSVRL